MWTGGSYDNDDVVRALVRLDRPELRPGTSGQSGKTVPTFSDPEVDAPTIVPGFEIWTTMYGPTTLERGSRRTARGRRCLRGRRDDDRTRGTIAIPGGFYLTDDGQEAIEENEVSHPGYRAVREDLNIAHKSRGFFGARRGASGRNQGPRMKRRAFNS